MLTNLRATISMHTWALLHRSATVDPNPASKIADRGRRATSCAHDTAGECNDCYFDRLADTAW